VGRNMSHQNLEGESATEPGILRTVSPGHKLMREANLRQKNVISNGGLSDTVTKGEEG